MKESSTSLKEIKHLKKLKNRKITHTVREVYHQWEIGGKYLRTRRIKIHFKIMESTYKTTMKLHSIKIREIKILICYLIKTHLD